MREASAVPPTALQDLLLRATFLPGTAGLDAWQHWKSSVELDGHVDLGSFRLLPELARRLRQQKITDPLLDRFAGISRKHWLANRLFFRDLEQLVKPLDARGVRVMVSGELALALVHHPDHPLDPLLDRAVVVPDHQAVAAFGVLEAAGWSPTPRITASLLDQYVAARCWHPFRGPGDRYLRLHWHVLPQRATRAVDRAYWSRATNTELGDEMVATLSPADHLIQLCTQRVGMRTAPMFIRAVNVTLLLSACRDRIDWNRVIAEAAQPGLALPIRETLGYLQDRLDVPVPAHAFERIQMHTPSRLERWEYRLTSMRPTRLGDLLSLWSDYRRASTTNVLASAVRFPRFLQYYLKLPRLWHTPFQTLARAIDDRPGKTGEALTRPRAARDAPTPGR